MVTTIQHASISIQTLSEIIEIKSLSWNYSPEEHLSWLKTNLNDNDWHFLMYDGDELIGYLNLVHVNVDKGEEKIPFLGVGNVCTRHKGRGDGLKIMKAVNTFLSSTRDNGLLFCKKKLVQFYEKADWHVISNLHPNNEVATMIYGYIEQTNDFSYSGRVF